MQSSYLKYLLALLLFGSNGIVASHIALPSYEIVFFRLILGSFFLLLLCLIIGEKSKPWQYPPDFLLNILSGMAMGASWLFVYEAYIQIGVSIASLLFYCGPVIVMALSTVLFGEKLDAKKILGFCAVIIGIFLINGQELSHSANLWGLFCGAMAAVNYALMVIFNKKATHITGITNSTVQLFGGLILVIFFLIFKGNFTMDIDSSSLVWIIMLGLINTGLGCYLYFSSMNVLPVQTVAVCGYLEPLSAVIFATVFLHEQMGVWQILGAVLIIGGALYCEISNLKRN